MLPCVYLRVSYRVPVCLRACPPACMCTMHVWYSFGVVLLELLTGRVPVDDNGTMLVHWVSTATH